MNEKRSSLLIIRVNTGKPVQITGVNIILRGDGQQDIDYQKIIEDGKCFVGKKLSHYDYEQFKNRFYNLALFKGYFDAKFQKSELVVIPSRYQCIWNIEFYSGQRYVLEKIKFIGSQIRGDYLDNISNMYVGNCYNVKSIMALNRRLYATNWFESVLISSGPTCIYQKKKLILNVLLCPKVKNSFEIGSGYSTDIGPRVRVMWKKPWINSYGHSLESNFSLSIIEQIFDLNYKIPFFRNPLEQYYLLQGGIIHEDIRKGNGSGIVTINISRYWNYSNNWQYAVNLHWNVNYIIRNYIDSKIKMLIYPGINMIRIRKRGEIMPYWGDKQRYSINISNTSWKSGVNFIILQAQNIWIRTFFKKHRVLARGNISWIKTNDLFSVIPLLRFFSSEDHSIRGYKHKSVFFQNVIGIAKFVISAFEYQYNVIGRWWSVIFIDVGEIENNIRWNHIKFGSGIGIRCQLPVGSMKVDVAIPLINKKNMNYRSLCLYINIGPEL